jgi:CSLREA domain-containing protein
MDGVRIMVVKIAETRNREGRATPAPDDVLHNLKEKIMTGRIHCALSTAVVLIALATTVPARAAVFTVTKTADTADGACSADCSLREAILAADAQNGPDVIVLGPGIYTLTRGGSGEDLGATGDLDLRDDVSIVGASAVSTVVDAGHLDRVFDVLAGVHAEIQGLTIRNGLVAGPGGGVRNAGSLTLSRSLVSGNAATTAAGFGGGIWSSGGGSELAVAASAVVSNSAIGSGGGLAVGAAAQVSNTTVAGNNAGDFGGGIYVYANTDGLFTELTVTADGSGQKGGGIFAEGSPFIGVNHPELRDTILAANTAPSQRDCSGAVRSGGYNLLGDGFDCIDFTAAHHDRVGTTAAPLNPQLGPLSLNGGPTPTYALLAGSPARGAGNNCGETDQRGQTRPAGGCDVGAYQVGNDCLDGGPILCLNQQRFRVTAAWKTSTGATGTGKGARLTGDSGTFWFFDPTNVELTVKVLNGCAANGRYWVFLSGLTNVQVTVTVTDAQTGRVKTYLNPLNTTFVSKLDTDAFNTCP